MFAAANFSGIMDIIYAPLGYLLRWIYMLVGNYGWAILIFALIAKLVLLPFGIQGEKSRVRMNAIQPKIKKLNEKYHNDKKDPKYQEELTALYQQEGYNPLSGCLPTLIQFPLIFGLWNAIRRPLVYVCLFSYEELNSICVKIVNSGLNSVSVGKVLQFFGNNMENWKDFKNALKTGEIYLADAINENRNIIDGIEEKIGNKLVINTNFLGINLGASASSEKGWFILVPIVAALTSLLVSLVSRKVSQSNLDQNDPTAKSMNSMMILMPLLSLWICWSMSFGVALYWIFSNVLSILQTLLLPKLIKAPVEEVVVKEKKLNYTQIEKMKRDGSYPIEDGDGEKRK